MLKRINAILTFACCLIVLSGCQPAMVPEGYFPKPKEVVKGISGSWIDITAFLEGNTTTQVNLSGELIAIQHDSVYVLTERRLIVLPAGGIVSAKLWAFAAPGRIAPAVGFLSYIPNIIGSIAYAADYGPYFLELGAPVVIFGVALGIIEAQGNGIMRYPKKYSLDEFNKFARFPQGLPPGLKRNKLHLLITKYPLS